MSRTLVLRGDAASLPLADESVDLIVTSPPYFGLRSYTDGGEHYAGQIGSEATPREFLEALHACTREWVRVLKPEGSLFVNLGDKYAGVGGSNDHGWCIESDSTRERRAKTRVPLHKGRTDIAPKKSLMGMPWRYALGCIDDLGLILRAEIVWAKPNGLPESVTDRVRRSHEQVFHMTKQPRYFSAVDEVREAHTGPAFKGRAGINAADWKPDTQAWQQGGKGFVMRDREYNPLGKLPGSVWEIPSQPLTVPAHLGVDHFAAFPMELPRRIILGWSPSGICTACGQGRRPIVDKRMTSAQRAAQPRSALTRYTALSRAQRDEMDVIPRSFEATITGYACACPDASAPTRPSVVVDPFGGTGTTALVASAFGRTGISVDRSADYCRLARWRTTDPAERARAMQVAAPPAVISGQGELFDALSTMGA